MIRKRGSVAAAGLALAGLLAAPAAPAAAQSRAQTRFAEVDLVSDIQGRAKLLDPKLVNPWGVALGPVSAVWVADNHTDSTTFYAGTVVKIPLDVAVQGGAPTGEVFNSTTDFKVKGSPAMFILDSESGFLTAWNLGTGATAVKVGNGGPGASYKGLALAHTGHGPVLLAADFHNARIDVFDKTFKRVTPPGSFRDPALPAGYSPFNVAVVNGLVFVAYAQKETDGDDEVAGPGKGFVDVFTTSGVKLHRFASQGALNAPWAVVQAPRSFGTYAGDILVGNFGDGRINAYDAFGHPKGPLMDKANKPITIEGLWGLAQGNAIAGGSGNLWFAAGIDDEEHGLMGLITPAK
ncbi:TIGR03118 family protein [Actinomadura barringtoniae]|uniref:TIGR03118 family protein n=1 Tax=Actinomadura barringtoniae TaxID=1427535 RepID=A0A939P9J9_9ACTN|nr:TIGR03118 family protein [Actinomadura barringtoniae]MBO2448333.1 TIGR03118 family protein [Actinomadura barringtoniae]